MTDVKLCLGDCLDVMAEMDADSVDSIVTDPPYGLEFMGKEWDKLGGGVECTAKSAGGFGKDAATNVNAFAAARVRYGSSAASMQDWHYRWAVAALRVAKPGAHLLAFGGTRTHHRLMCAIEDAGWEIRDVVMWVYSTGFPKGHAAGYAIHKRAEQEAEHDLRFVRATYLQTPVYACAECGQVLLACMSEPSASQRWRAWAKPTFAGAEQSGMEGWSHLETPARELYRCPVCTMSHGLLADGPQGRICDGASAGYGTALGTAAGAARGGTSPKPRPVGQPDREPDAVRLERRAQAFRGWNVALKPAYEPVIVARKPLIGTVAANVLEYGTGAMNIDGCRVEGQWERSTPWKEDMRGGRLHAANGNRTYDVAPQASHPAGRWPSNLIHDGSDEVTGLFPNDAQRFFYCAKASKSDRDEGLEGMPEAVGLVGNKWTDQDYRRGDVAPSVARRNHHPTVKPTSLMRYLCRLVTQPGGVVLDPFMGSGSTGKAAALEGLDFIGIEMDAEYLEIARRRIEHAQMQPALDELL